ncbi:hypothetical protein [Sphingopyxis sp. PET50]|uniref:hypothetical protein n=1 Tax=Sphingopyxis sp. PET50 TaxID=2976533 RepID=UPI0021AE6A71|nr:hypothetical protein [Sphingopyxis sp. PET50]
MSARPSNLHRELANAGIKGDALRDFAVFALGWFGNADPVEAVTCLKIYQRDVIGKQERAA